MRRLLFAFSSASLLFAAPALADDAPPLPPPLTATSEVVVVDVVSESLDADAIRASIGKELGKPVVAPEDARAQTATGWLTVEPHEGKLTVTYRPLGALVARTVDLPDDATRARKLAALLAGNVARDEASELAEALKKKPPSPSPEERPAPPPEPAPDIARLRSVLELDRDAERKARATHGWISLGVGVAASVPAIYFLASDRDSQRLEHSFGAFLVSTAAANVATGIVDLAVAPKTDHEVLLDQLDAEIGKGATPAAATAAVEEAWKDKAEASRRNREGAALAIGTLGALGIGMGVGVPLLAKDSRASQGMYTFSEISIGVGSFLLALAPLVYFSESRTETTFHTYSTMAHGRPTPAPETGFRPQKPRVGFAPTPGGGGVASVGFVF